LRLWSRPERADRWKSAGHLGSDALADANDAWWTATGKVAYRPGEFTIEGLDAALGQTPGVGLWLDTSDLTPQETVAEIVRRESDAVVDGVL